MEHSLFAVENPLMDIIAHVDAGLLERFGKRPGTMHLVERPEIEALRAAIGQFRTVPGGSAANTARGVAWLAGDDGRAFVQNVLGHAAAAAPTVAPPVFNGAIGRDRTGDEFASRMEEAHVRTSLVRKSTPTGTSVILVTPDGERTMNTFLGACRDFGPDDLDRALLVDSEVLYLTGYLWDTDNQRIAAEKAAALAHADGRRLRVAFDLADPFAVERSGARFREWIPRNVDILFGNRAELALLTGRECDDDCVREAAGSAPLIVMKTGADGCLVGWEGRVVAVPPAPARVVDTTGAGDAFAAGFLYGLMAGRDPVTAARLANALAARIVGVEGCTYGV
jgi:sugar/nucleoside kinase (ribokinase family)